jgi:hypothetical protein
MVMDVRCGLRPEKVAAGGLAPSSRKAGLIILNQAERLACEYVGALRYGVEFGARRARQGSRLQLLPRGWSQRSNADSASALQGEEVPPAALSDQTTTLQHKESVRANNATQWTPSGADPYRKDRQPCSNVP